VRFPVRDDLGHSAVFEVDGGAVHLALWQHSGRAIVGADSSVAADGLADPVTALFDEDSAAEGRSGYDALRAGTYALRSLARWCATHVITGLKLARLIGLFPRADESVRGSWWTG
jgi:hypothetical protein